MYETFDHTADIGIRVRATELPVLFREAAEALFSLIAEPIEADPRAPRTTIEVAGERVDLLLFDWLSELLYRSDRDRAILCDFVVELVRGGLVGSAAAVPADAARGTLLREVKAITYHGLVVERVGADWIAEFIVDV